MLATASTSQSIVPLPSAWPSCNNAPLDCSAAVSKVLGIDPRVSGDFERFGSPGRAPKGGVTIYANKGHVLMEIGGRFWGTSKSNPNGGAGRTGWRSPPALSR